MLKGLKVVIFLISLCRFLFFDVLEWFLDLENCCKVLLSFFSINLVEFLVLYNFEIVVFEMFGFKFLMYCFIKLLLCLVDLFKGMLYFFLL